MNCTKTLDDICVLIQARLGSQRVPQKMIRPFAGTTLTDIALGTVKDCKSFPLKNFYLSAYEQELVDIAQNNAVNVFHRSEKSANSEGTPMTEMYEWWDRLPYKYCILINACAPLLTAATIDGFVEAFRKSESEGMFGVIEKKNYFWNNEGDILTPLSEAVMNTKTAPTTYEAAHCLYAGRMDAIGRGIWMGDFNLPGDIELYPLEEREVFDVDYEWQFTVAESLYGDKYVIK